MAHTMRVLLSNISKYPKRKSNHEPYMLDGWLFHGCSFLFGLRGLIYVILEISLFYDIVSIKSICRG